MDFFDNAEFCRGVRLFNDARYFEAHEVLEDVWRGSQGESRRFLQGLVQVAVALHHDSTGNRVGAASVLARARRNLAPYGAEYGGIAGEALRASLAEWQEAIAAETTRPARPRIVRHAN